MKRGISPLISSVLLIAFVVTLFLVISNWLTKDVVEGATSKTEEKLAGQLDCLSASIDATNVCVDVLAAATTLKLNIDNDGDENIKSVIIRVLGSGGDLELVTTPPSGDFAPLARISSKSDAAMPLDGTVADAYKVEVYPVIDSGTCKDQISTASITKAC